MSKTEVEVNKSEKIREYLKACKPSDRSPTAVAEALKTKGIEVSPAFVSQVKNKMANKKKTIKAKAKIKVKSKAKKARRKSFSTMPHEALLNAKDFLNSAGGLAQAKKLLDVVDSLMS